MKVTIVQLENNRLGVVFNDAVTISYHTQFTGITEEIVQEAVNQLMIFVNFDTEKINWLIEKKQLPSMLTAFIQETIQRTSMAVRS